MTVPHVTHLPPPQFAALAVLLDGATHRNTAIAKAAGYHRPDSFGCILFALEEKGFVDRVTCKRAGEPQFEGYKITAAGRSAWRETLDLYLFFAKRFGGKPPAAARETVTPAPTKRRGESDRRANETEAKAIIAASTPRSAALLKAVACGPLLLDELIALDMADVDFATSTVRRGRRRIPFGPALATIFAGEIGDRTEGPVFLRDNGERWTTRHASQAYSGARDRAGVSRRVKLFGRLSPSIRHAG